MKDKIIKIPLKVFESAQTKEELEDRLLVQAPDFIKRMRKARKDYLEGKGKDWETIKKELRIK